MTKGWGIFAQSVQPVLLTAMRPAPFPSRDVALAIVRQFQISIDYARGGERLPPRQAIFRAQRESRDTSHPRATQQSNHADAPLSVHLRSRAWRALALPLPLFPGFRSEARGSSLRRTRRLPDRGPFPAFPARAAPEVLPGKYLSV